MTEPHTEPERIDLAQADDRRDVVHRAVACLAQGGIVGLATETVYGLVATALRPDAVQRLTRIQRLDGPDPVTLLARGAVEVLDWVPQISALGFRLARRAWPGPVTLIFPDSEAGGLGSRLPAVVRPWIFPDTSVVLQSPAHPFIREVIRLLPAPLVMVKAVGPDGRFATTAAGIADLSDVAMLVDEGPTLLGGVATSVRVEGDRWGIVRPGAVDATALRRMAGTIILFVCTGNTCRSPMAEALFKVLLARRLGCLPEELEQQGYVVLSAGIAAAPGMRAASHAIDVVRARGGSLEQHASRPLTFELTGQADHIIAMTSDHLESLIDAAPECTPRVRLLHPQGDDVADPVGSDRETYLRTARAIEEYLGKLLEDLKF